MSMPLSPNGARGRGPAVGSGTPGEGRTGGDRHQHGKGPQGGGEVGAGDDGGEQGRAAAPAAKDAGLGHPGRRGDAVRGGGGDDLVVQPVPAPSRGEPEDGAEG